MRTHQENQKKRNKRSLKSIKRLAKKLEERCPISGATDCRSCNQLNKCAKENIGFRA